MTFSFAQLYGCSPRAHIMRSYLRQAKESSPDLDGEDLAHAAHAIHQRKYPGDGVGVQEYLTVLQSIPAD